MKLINQKLYLTLAECVLCGMKENYLLKAKSVGTKCWDFMDDPADKRKVLVGYEALSPVNRKLVDDRFGNVWDQVAREPILAMVVNDHKAVEFYKGFKYESGVQGTESGAVKYLPLHNTDKHVGGTVNKYVRAASWLRMLGDLDKKMVKVELGVSIAEFYINVGKLISQERENGKKPGYTGMDVLPGEFPGTYQRLMAKVSEWCEVRKAEGELAAYASLINGRIGNMNGSKLGKMSAGSEERRAVGGAITQEELTENAVMEGEIDPKSGSKRGAFTPELYAKQTAVIRYCASLGNNLDAGQVQKIVNRVFALKGWETLSVRTFSKFIKEHSDILTPGRKGKRAYMNNVAMQNKRKGPPYPMLYCTLDGWTVELMYREYDTKGRKWDYKRLVVVVVLDPYNKYPMGYAIGDRETAELIRTACRNAIMHTQELFGQVYQPMQVQSDRYQIKHLTPFYQAMVGKYYTPAEVGNSKAKVIEPYFMYLNKAYCQAEAKNWSGFNVDASKTNQVNKEWLDMIKGQFPEKAEVEKQIHDIIARERNKKRAQYVERWSELPEKDKIPVGVMDYLQMFGTELGGRTNKIEGQGIIKQVGGAEYTYDSFDPLFRKNLHIDWTLILCQFAQNFLTAKALRRKEKYNVLFISR